MVAKDFWSAAVWSYLRTHCPKRKNFFGDRLLSPVKKKKCPFSGLYPDSDRAFLSAHILQGFSICAVYKFYDCMVSLQIYNLQKIDFFWGGGEALKIGTRYVYIYFYHL